MPEIRRFVVSQGREVTVTASNAFEAAKLAEAAFNDTAKGQFDGYLSGKVEVTGMSVRREI